MRLEGLPKESAFSSNKTVFLDEQKLPQGERGIEGSDGYGVRELGTPSSVGLHRGICKGILRDKTGKQIRL